MNKYCSMFNVKNLNLATVSVGCLRKRKRILGFTLGFTLGLSLNLARRPTGGHRGGLWGDTRQRDFAEPASCCISIFFFLRLQNGPLYSSEEPSQKKRPLQSPKCLQEVCGCTLEGVLKESLEPQGLTLDIPSQTRGGPMA